MGNQQSCSKNPTGKTAEQAGVSVEQASVTTDMTLIKSDSMKMPSLSGAGLQRGLQVCSNFRQATQKAHLI